MALISQIGEQVDYLRFMPNKTKENKKSRYLGTLIAGPGWILLGGIKILIGAFLGVYLISIETPFKNAIDPNLCTLRYLMKQHLFRLLCQHSGTSTYCSFCWSFSN